MRRQRNRQQDAQHDAEFKQTVMREIAGVMAALAEPARLELLDLLCQCERGVEEVARGVGSKATTVSHHLHVLQDRKLARSRKQGRSVRYSATPLGVRLWGTIAELAAAELSEIKVAISELLEAEKTEENEQTAEQVDYGELLRRLMNDEVVVVDVRPREEFDAGHLPGAGVATTRHSGCTYRRRHRRMESFGISH